MIKIYSPIVKQLRESADGRGHIFILGMNNKKIVDVAVQMDGQNIAWRDANGFMQPGCSFTPGVAPGSVLQAYNQVEASGSTPCGFAKVEAKKVLVKRMAPDNFGNPGGHPLTNYPNTPMLMIDQKSIRCVMLKHHFLGPIFTPSGKAKYMSAPFKVIRYRGKKT